MESLAERVVFGTADNDVVEKFDAEDVSGFPKLLGDTDVFAARRRITGGMIVGDDDGRGGLQDSEFENFARVDEATAGGAQSHQTASEWLVLSVESNDPERFLHGVLLVGSLHVIHYRLRIRECFHFTDGNEIVLDFGFVDSHLKKRNRAISVSRNVREYLG